MATVQELATNVAELSGRIDALKARVGDDLDALRATVEAQALDQAALDAINAKIDDLDTTVDGIDAAPPVPVDPEDPPADPTTPTEPETPPTDPTIPPEG